MCVTVRNFDHDCMTIMVWYVEADTQTPVKDLYDDLHCYSRHEHLRTNSVFIQIQFQKPWWCFSSLVFPAATVTDCGLMMGLDWGDARVTKCELHEHFCWSLHSFLFCLTTVSWFFWLAVAADVIKLHYKSGSQPHSRWCSYRYLMLKVNFSK